MKIKKIYGFLLNILVAMPVYPITAASSIVQPDEDIKIKVIDLIAFPKKVMFVGASTECWVPIDRFSVATRGYPVKLIITNNSSTTWKLLPNQIGGNVDTHYQDMVKKLPLGYGPKSNSFIRAFLGLMCSCVGGILGVGAIIDEHKWHYPPIRFLKRLRDESLLKIKTGAVTGAFLLTILFQNKANVALNAIQNERFLWFCKNGLSSNGIFIKPGQTIEKILIRPERDYIETSSLIISLIEPVYNGRIKTFNVALSSSSN